MPTPPLYVVVPYFNPLQHRVRKRLYEEFVRRVHQAGAQPLTVEVAFGVRPWEVTSPTDRWHLCLRTDSELWLKEVALNLAVQRLPDDWRNVAWVDADLLFAHPDWAEATVRQLEHTPVCQMFSRAVDLSPDYEPMHTHRGFAASMWDGSMKPGKATYEQAHPGFCWAWRRDAFETVGGFFDVGVLGSGDRHMACALFGDVGSSHPSGLSDGYVEQLELWAARAARLAGNVGYVPGTILHYYHGPKALRGYADRWKILVKHQYDPEFDLQRDWQGLYRLTDRSPGLRDDIRKYFRARLDDCVDPAHVRVAKYV